MRVRILILALSLSVAVPALASDKVETGPAPSWAKPVVLPAATADPAGVSARILVDSRHVRAEPGRVLVHSVTAVKFLTPDGLQGGNVALQWRPDKDRVEVHKLAIVRGGKEIDVLASGQRFTTIQREQNLEMAMFDGRLTAVLQPEGLQVGDTLYFEMTMTSTDPVMGRHVEFFSGLADQASARRIDLRAEWPSGVDLAYRGYHLPAGKVTRQAGWTSVEWHLDDPAPFVAPKSAPARFRMGRRLEFSDTKSWDSIAALVRPLFDRAAVIPATGALRDEVEKIRTKSADSVARAEAALILVEDRIRYVALLMDAGNYVPDSAETTWSRRFGDCKAKTALLTAILRELGIAADPVMVSSAGGDGLDQRLPMLASFDHVLVRATIAGRDYFLDGTRSGDWKLDRIAVPPFHWGLPLVADAKLIAMRPAPLALPQSDTLIHIDASGAGSSRNAEAIAPARFERLFRGDSALVFNMIVGKLPVASRDKMLRDYWSENFSRFTPKTAAGQFNREKGEYRLTTEGEMKLELEGGRYYVDVPTLGYKPDFKREPGPLADAPLALSHPDYSRTEQVIILPDEASGTVLARTEPIDKIVAGVRYRRLIARKGSRFTIETSEQTLVPEIPFAQALAAEAELKRMDDDDYWVGIATPTKEETDKLLAATPTNSGDYFERGTALALADRHPEAVIEFDKALALNPKSIASLENRGFSKMRSNDLAGARLDFEAASALGSKLPLLSLIKASEAASGKNYDQALVHVDDALKVQPDQLQALLFRAEINRLKRDFPAALADSQRATAFFPTSGHPYQFRINMYQRQGKRAEAVREAEAMMKLTLADPYPYVVAALTFSANDRKADAVRAFDKAIATRPEGYVYINRGQARPVTDIAGRLADFREGVRLDPTNPTLIGILADELGKTGDWKAAIEQYDKAIAAEPTYTYPRVSRGLAYLRLGQAARAEADFAFVRAEAERDAVALNNACWEKAMAGLALESGLGDCDRAIALDPQNEAYHDSRGLVLLRLGRIDDSLAAYDRALKSDPRAASLFGRALAWSRKGDRARAAADRAAAEKLSPKIADWFRGFGLTLAGK